MPVAIGVCGIFVVFLLLGNTTATKIFLYMGYDKSSPVKLRGRKMASGNTSLYLDIYMDGRREYEYLHLYLIPEKTKADKQQNRQTREFAEAVRAKRILEIRNGEYGFRPAKAKGVSFWRFYEAQAVKRYGTPDQNKWRMWGSLYRWMRHYDKREDLKISDITPRWVQGLKSHLDGATKINVGNPMRARAGQLKDSSKRTYLRVLSVALSAAVREGLIIRSPMVDVDNYPVPESKREYLTQEEIRALSATPCSSDIARRAFLFSCLTGLRYSDIRAVMWGDVHEQGGFTRIIFRQKKTKGQEYLDISPQAVRLMGERDNADTPVFCGLLMVAGLNRHLAKWVSDAGINKHITFHCARHTFATLMLDIGTDLYTVSKLLGHRDIKTTQIYAKIIDKNKQKAVANIPDLIGE